MPHQVWHQLSMASQKGFEPPTDGLGNRCSILLSYWDRNKILLNRNKKFPKGNKYIIRPNRLKAKNGVPGGIRTPDRRLRRPVLYPAELLGHLFSFQHIELYHI